MATQLFLLSGDPDTHLATDSTTLRSTNPGWSTRPLGTARGSGVIASSDTATVAGTTPGVEITIGTGVPAEWISPPVSADVTISGTITANIWASENNMSANVAINVVIDIIRANATGTRNSNTIVEIVRSTRVTEVAVTTRAVNNFTTGMTSGAYTSQTLNRGDRLRIRVFGDDVGTMASGFTFNIGFNGNTAAADGDTYVTFTEDFSFESAPSGSQLFLTNVQSGLSGAPALISDFTGSDENPLSEGGNWARVTASGNQLIRVSNAVSRSLGTEGESYWTPTSFGPDLEVYVTLSTINGNSAILFRLQEVGTNTYDGYKVQNVGTTTINITRIDNGANTTLSSTSITLGNGDKLGVRCEGSTIQAWRQASGSSDWNLVSTVVDATYSTSGRIGLQAASTTVRLDDFYAATDSNLFTQKAWTSRGAGVVSYLSDTDVGWVAPLYTMDWYTPQLAAFTLTGMAQANIRALESSVSANASLRLEIARVDSDGSNATVWASWCIAPTTDAGELTTSEVARTANVSGDDLAISAGQRLRIRIYLEDTASAAMANAFNVQTFYNGTSAAASGDSYVTFAQTLSEFVAEALPPQHVGVDFGGLGVLTRGIRRAWHRRRDGILVPELEGALT